MFKDVDLAGIGIEGSSDLADELSTMPTILFDPSLGLPRRNVCEDFRASEDHRQGHRASRAAHCLG
jgi:hypothetical protein